MTESVRVPWPGGEVSGEWDRPAAGARATLVLAHGAGGTLRTQGLRDLGAALAADGVAVLRFNFGYTEAGRKAPDRMPRLLECFEAAARVAEKEGAPLFLGGRSMGGRVASHLAADGFACAGLVFLAYPLHPPGKPDMLRDEHLGRIAAPILWIQGTRDPFATPELLHRTVARLPRVTLVEIESGDHSFKVPGRAAADVTADLASTVGTFCRPEA